jgi:tetratricopeptide (TPR) repeat protein
MGFGPKVKITVLFILFFTASWAQRNLFNTDPQTTFRDALWHFEEGKYAASQRLFQEVIKVTDSQAEMEVESRFYEALCSFELFNDDARNLLESFVNDYPESQKIKVAFFYLGNLYYRQRNYRDALEWYEKADASILKAEQRYEFKFKKGYCYFSTKKPERAKVLFNEIKDRENKYAAPATYYFSHISYTEGNYEVALSGFKKFSGESSFAPLIPYYITHILYLQKKYDEVVEYARPLLDSANVNKVADIAHLIGDSYFKLKRYGEAVPYFERYLNAGGKIERDDYYAIAYAYYMTRNYEKAIDNYKKVASVTDSTSQTAYYHMGDSYLKLDNKQQARNAFETASKFSFDKEITEDALWNFAKLSYELSYNPYHEAVNAFHRYIDSYPKSPRIEEAYRLLVNVYLSTKNYKEALNSIERIKKKNLELEIAYQKIAYFRGVELFNDRNYEQAIEHFSKSLTFKKDKRLSALAHYWKADAFYKLNRFDAAEKEYKAFLFEPGAASLKEFELSYYNLGYCAFKKEEYKESITWFRKFTGNKNQVAKRLVNDALIRTGDAYFILKEYDNAVENYAEALRLNLISSDYATFQLAVAAGLNGNSSKKIEKLNSLLADYPNSDYADDAKYELGNTYLQLAQYAQAIKFFKQVIDQYPNGSYAKRSQSKLALCYYNSDDNTAALETYKQIIRNHPSSPEAKEALNGIRNIFTESGDIASFEEFIKSKEGAAMSATVLDSTAYESAEKKYMKGEFDQALRGFEIYLEKFPNGFFALQANHYKADCHFRNREYLPALPHLEFVISKPRNRFTENALARASFISYQQKDFEKARKYYEMLEKNAEIASNLIDARAGLMRTNFILNDYLQASDYARRLIGMDKTSKDLINEANLIIGKSALKKGDDQMALAQFTEVSKVSQAETGAEAHYLLAELYFRKKDYEKCEKSIFDLIDRVPSYDYWIAKGFILLGDLFVAQDDLFQAKETFQSIVEKCEIPELVREAGEKLTSVLEEDQNRESLKKKAEMKIEFNNNSERDNRLFEDSIPVDNNDKQEENEE